jgi:predicted DNA-binding transcriptional regulator YafY
MNIDKMKKNRKISSTAYRVLLLLKLMNENSFSIDEFNTVLSNDPFISRTFSNEVILKYLSTLRLAGYKITKPCIANNYTYKLLKAPLRITLSDEELKALIIVDSFVLDMHQQSLLETRNKLIEKVSRYIDDEQIHQLQLLKKKYRNTYSVSEKTSKFSSLMSKIEQFCIDDQKILLKYKYPGEESETQLTLEPKYLDYIGGEVYICGYNPIIGERRLIKIDYIIDIKQLPNKSSSNNILSPVVFVLKGRLAKVYELHESEKVTETNAELGTVTITSYADCKNMLLQRLLKYGDLCEVIYPKSCRDEIITTLEKTLKNYNIELK